MDALLYRPWWEEEEFAQKLRLPIRPVRQILRLLETHFLLAREHRKERRRKKGQEADATTAMEGDVVDESMQERGNLISYCSLDYQRFFDMTRLRLWKMNHRLKEELEDRRAVQEYLCPGCGRTYTTLQAPFLIKPDGMFHCEECDTVLEASADGQVDGKSRRERAKAVKAKQAKLNEELKPLMVLLAEIEKKIAGGEQIPDFGTLTMWAESEARRATGGRATNNTADQAPSEPQISFAISGQDIKNEDGAEAGPRELPPWLLKQSRGQATPTSTSYSLSQEVSGDFKDFKDIKSPSPEEKKRLAEDEAMRAYKERMAAMAQQNDASKVKRQRLEEGWQEVKAEMQEPSGWQEISMPAAASPTEPPIKQEPGENAETETGDAEWEDA